MRKVFLVVTIAGTLVGCGKGAPTLSVIPRTRPTATSPVSSTKVSMTAQHFEPQIITVRKGTTVTWTNTDSLSHWVASDPYPIDTGYPGFASAGPTAPGQTYQFTFDRVGQWSYHDQLRPVTYTGTVVVTE